MNASYKAIVEAYTQNLKTLGFAASTCYDFPRFVAKFLEYTEQKAVCQINHITTKTVWNYFFHLEKAKSKRTGTTFSSSHLNRIFLAVDKLLEFLHLKWINRNEYRKLNR
jgi:site-specific recombinase XerD